MELVIQGNGVIFEDEGCGGHVDSKERVTIAGRLLEQHIIDELGFDSPNHYPYAQNIGNIRITVDYPCGSGSA